MSVLARPNPRLRLLTMFGIAIGVCGIVASAVYALAWVVLDFREGRNHELRVAGARFVQEADVRLPNGLIAVIPVETIEDFEQLAGFTPFIPSKVPETTDGTPSLGVTLPDDDGNRVGRVAFSARRGAEVDGIGGPKVVLVEAQGEPGERADGELRPLTVGAGRAIAGTIDCGDLVIDVQLYFSPEAQPGEEPLTPYMIAVAANYIEELQRECFF